MSNKLTTRSSGLAHTSEARDDGRLSGPAPEPVDGRLRLGLQGPELSNGTCHGRREGSSVVERKTLRPPRRHDARFPMPGDSCKLFRLRVVANPFVHIVPQVAAKRDANARSLAAGSQQSVVERTGWQIVRFRRSEDGGPASEIGREAPAFLFGLSHSIREGRVHLRLHFGADVVREDIPIRAPGRGRVAQEDHQR
eukprot:scaffold8205_cov239-Pinguiococcus_pyrenoidosus.AAC.1